MSAEEVRDAIKDLNNADEFVQLEAENIVAMNMPDQIDVLHEEILKPLHKDIKISLIEILSAEKDPNSIDVFVQLLEDDNKWVRRQSSTALASYGEDAVDALLEVTKNPDWRARGGAVWALAKIGEPDTLDVFLEASHDEKSFVRSGSVHGLGRIGGDEALARLKELADSEDSGYVKANAITFIDKLES